MKLHTEDRPVTRSGAQSEKEFSIRATEKAFQILSSGLYSNKIAAPIRELCCNAYDAHVVAGCADTPFEVHLPTALDPTFYVKDFGTGLSHEGVMDLYTTYFESTKQFDNNVIGALGLGSKSPFAYTDTFSVESRYNGTKRLYTAFINEQGVPSIVSMCDPFECDEPNGMTISFAVRSEDFSRFYEQARVTLMYFKPTPTIVGYTVKPYDLTHTVSGDRWAIREANWAARMSGAFVVQGFVAYPVDSNQLTNNSNLSPIARRLLSTNIDLTVSIGDVDIAPSREALQYNKRSVEAIAARLEAAAAEISKRLQDEIAACPNLWMAQMKHAELTDRGNAAMRTLYREIISSQGAFKYNDIIVNGAFDINTSGIKETKMTMMSRTSGRKRNEVIGTWQPGSMIATFEIHAKAHIRVVVADLAKGTTQVLDRFMLEERSRVHTASGGHTDTARALVIAPTNCKRYNATEVAQLLAPMAGADIVYLSHLPYANEYANVRANGYQPRPKGQVLKFTGFSEKEQRYGSRTHRVFSRNTWERVAVDFNAGGYYVRLDRLNAIDERGIINMLDRIIEEAINTKILPAGTIVYGFNEKDLAEINGSTNWYELTPFVTSQLKPLVISMSHIAAVTSFASDFGRDTVSFASEWTKRYPNDTTKFGKFLAQIDNGSRSDGSHSSVHSLANMLHVSMGSATKMAAQLRIQLQEARNEYPMLQYTRLSADAGLIRAIKEYVDQVDFVANIPVAQAA